MRKKFTLLVIMMIAGWTLAIAQNSTIRGVVRDDQGNTLPGVSVVVKGTSSGIATDNNGNYTITAPPSGTLVFSFIGSVTQEIAINNRTVINVALVTGSNKLNEVVVVGYGTQTRKDLSTAVSTVGAKDIGRQVVTSFENALQGQAPGVQINNPTGQPGSAINVSIRGLSSISLTTGPLYVIDGVPVQPSYDEEVSLVTKGQTL